MNFIDLVYSFFNNYPGLYIYIGAIISHMFSPYDENYKGTKPFFITILKNKSDMYHARLDFFVLPIITFIFAFALIHPVTITAAITTGLTGNTTIIAMIKNLSNKKG